MKGDIRTEHLLYRPCTHEGVIDDINIGDDYYRRGDDTGSSW